jgi:predicted nucleic acid-binding protein
MSQFFFDSSALVKRYLTEIGSPWVDAQTDPTAGNAIVVAEITRVEVAAALAARHRASGGITRVERDRLFRLLAQHVVAEYRAIPISIAVTDHAMQLTQQHRLRGYDAMQLASALAVAAVLPGLVFVAADDDLLAAARAEGLAAENPNAHP